MENDELKPQDSAADGSDTDGYYGEDDAGAEDLDLSFLDEEDEDGEPGSARA